LAVFDQKQCAVSRALDQTRAAVQKLIRLPFQRDAPMRATVFVNEDLALAPHGENGQLPDFKPAAFSFSDSVSITKVAFRG
jgi:hypothetical protein